MRLPVNKPKNISTFLEALQTVKTQKKKAANLLFEEIEQDVVDKEKFVIAQTEKIKEMNEHYLSMLDYHQVLENVKVLIPRLHGGGVRHSIHGGIEDEEENKGFSINDPAR